MGNTEVPCAASVEGRVPPFLRNSGMGWVRAPLSSSGSDAPLGVLELQGHEPRNGVAMGRPDLLDQRFFSEGHPIGLSICRKPLFVCRVHPIENLRSPWPQPRRISSYRRDAADIGHEDTGLARDIGADIPRIGQRIEGTISDFVIVLHPRRSSAACSASMRVKPRSRRYKLGTLLGR